MTDAQDRLKACPTHRCLVCEKSWIKWEDGTWTLVSGSCGLCCDNAAMGGQMVALADIEAWKPAVEHFRRAASVRGMSDMRAYLTVRSIVEDAPPTPDAQPSSTEDDPLGDGSDLGVTGEWWGTASSTDEVERVATALQSVEPYALSWSFAQSLARAAIAAMVTKP
jgi:hypothetical protein